MTDIDFTKGLHLCKNDVQLKFMAAHARQLDESS
jgi:hypothetical protein